MTFLYLHGFASGPDSHKGRYFAEAFARRGMVLNRLDLNVGDFAHLTITAQLALVRSVIDSSPEPTRSAANDRSSGIAEDGITLIGSSLGGYVSLLYAQTDARVRRLVLLAPALGFDRLIRRRAGPEGLKTWRKEGSLPVEHYQWQRTVPVHYDLYSDAVRCSRLPLDRILPVQIFHGINDESVPWKNSLDILQKNSAASLVLLPSDHSLTDCLPLIESQMMAWLQTQTDA